MNNLLKEVRSILVKKIEDIDTGNSNLDEESLANIVRSISESTDLTVKISKYKFSQLIHVSTSTFDNYVRDGKIPKGCHDIGFKELFWTMKDVKDFKEKYWNKKD